jgi:membrane protein implicated in regulation of membrane protease activity
VRVLGLYLFAMIIGVGLLLFTILGGGDSDASDAAFEADADLDMEHATGMAAGIGEIVLGLFRPRNLTFLLAAFGTTGALLTWAGTNAASAFLLAASMGIAAWFVSHAVFTWLRRTDSAIDALDDRDLEGTIGRVTLPIGPGSRGRVMVEVAGRQAHLTARLASDVDRALPIGTEILIHRTEGGVAEVMPTDVLGLPPTTRS